MRRDENDEEVRNENENRKKLQDNTDIKIKFRGLRKRGSHNQ